MTILTVTLKSADHSGVDVINAVGRKDPAAGMNLFNNHLEGIISGTIRGRVQVEFHQTDRTFAIGPDSGAVTALTIFLDLTPDQVAGILTHSPTNPTAALIELHRFLSGISGSVNPAAVSVDVNAGGFTADYDRGNNEPPPILLVTAGQSNVGNNNASNLTIQEPKGKVWWWHEDATVYYSGAGTSSSTGTTGNSFVDQAIVTATTPDKYCADVAVMRSILPCRYAQSLRCWQGSTNLYSDWAPPPHSGSKNLFGLLDGEGTQAVAHASFTLESTYEVWFWWVQGYTDASSALHSSNYETRLGQLWTAFKGLTWVTGRNPKMIVSRLNSLNTRTYRADVQAAQDAFVAANDDAFMVNTDFVGLFDDDHYSSADLDRIGVRAADIIINNT